MKNYFLFLIFLLFLGIVRSSGQVPVNTTGWYGYEGYHPFKEGEPLGLMLEGYIKRNNVVLDPMQWFFRIGLNYQLKNGNRISGGYAYQYNIPYDDPSEPYNWSDHRIWEQFIIRKPFEVNKRGMFMHRFRMEQRWLERQEFIALGTTHTYWKFENTFRYQFKVNLPISNKWSLSLYDELHLRTTELNSEKLFDQNRIYAGFVFYVDKKREWRIEPGYMFQSTFNSLDTQDGRKRINNVFRVTITSDAVF